MLQAAIAGLILLGVYKIIHKDEDKVIDWWMTFTFIFAPGILIVLLQLGLTILEVNPFLFVIGYTLYFIIPYLMLAKGLDFPRHQATKLAGVVPVVAILAEIPFFFLPN